MSIEAIQQVTQAETAAQEKKLTASTQAKQLARDAEQAGQLLLEQTRQRAEGQSRDAMAAAEQAAAQRTEAVLAETSHACDLLCSAAEDRLHSAAALIIKRVVNV